MFCCRGRSGKKNGVIAPVTLRFRNERDNGRRPPVRESESYIIKNGVKAVYKNGVQHRTPCASSYGVTNTGLYALEERGDSRRKDAVAMSPLCFIIGRLSNPP